MRRLASLSDDQWRFGSVPPQPFGPVNDLVDVKEWLPAVVPGDVRLDLLRAKRIPDPFFGKGSVASRWVDELDWWYVRDVDSGERTASRRFVIFDGIDYQSAVFWNGNEVGRHTGMFSRQVYELPSGQAGELGIRIWGAHALPQLSLGLGERSAGLLTRRFLPSNPAFPDRIATLKCQMSFGWDFAPRLLTCGIWDDAALIQTRTAIIRDIRVIGVPDGRVNVHVNIDVDREIAFHATVTAAGSNFSVAPERFDFALSASPNNKDQELKFQLREPREWNPWDRGAPNLYRLDLILADETGELDSISTRFGLRSIDLAPNPDAPPDEPPWTFVVNGEREFIRGANWVPADAIPARAGRDEYLELVQLARTANVNLLRVWGGGLREKSVFYDLCDELGILVWQEFPFSGAPLDSLHRDDSFFSFVRAECGDIVRSLRNHPSIALWCGGNEFSTTLNTRLVGTLREVVALNDGTRPFKPASPSIGEDHDWRVWHWSANTRDYRKDDASFFGEFGLQSPPNPERLKHFVSPSELWPPGRDWTHHNAEIAKLWRYARAINSAATSLEEFVQASQEAQLRGLQVMIEHVRRRKGRVGGCAFWQFDEPWPAVCWSVVDYGRRPKPAYFKIRQLYNPILVSFDYPLTLRKAGGHVRGDIWLINDTLKRVEGELRGALNGERVLTQAVRVSVNDSAKVGEITIVLQSGTNLFTLELLEEGRLVSTNEYDLNYCDRGELGWLSAHLEGISARFKR